MTSNNNLSQTDEDKITDWQCIYSSMLLKEFPVTLTTCKNLINDNITWQSLKQLIAIYYGYVNVFNLTWENTEWILRTIIRKLFPSVTHEHDGSGLSELVLPRFCHCLLMLEPRMQTDTRNNKVGGDTRAGHGTKHPNARVQKEPENKGQKDWTGIEWRHLRWYIFDTLKIIYHISCDHSYVGYFTTW